MQKEAVQMNGLLYAYLMDGKGSAKRLDWESVNKWKPQDGPLWLHFDYTSPETIDWITSNSGLDEVVIDSLLSEESRPRAAMVDGGLLAALRGVNLNPGSDPEDMVAIRLWVEQDRLITTRRRKLLSEDDIIKAFEANQGPENTSELLVEIAGNLISRMGGTVEEFEDRTAQIEEDIIDTESYSLRSKISELRREAIMLRRHLAPQREAMTRIQTEKIAWMQDRDRVYLREITDQLMRFTEDLDSVRDRAAVSQEELSNRLAEQMNTRMYVLSIVAALFMPLGFLTGLLGINVAGIPGAEYRFAFWVFILFLCAVVILQILIFKKKKWF
nr:zinc transporter ZntB [Limihaloglobus sulfuriphilus]